MKNCTVTDLDTAYELIQNRNRKVVVKNLVYENDGTISLVGIDADDLVFLQNGSMTDASVMDL
jgi:oleate hydratase